MKGRPSPTHPSSARNGWRWAVVLAGSLAVILAARIRSRTQSAGLDGLAGPGEPIAMQGERSRHVEPAAGPGSPRVVVSSDSADRPMRGAGVRPWLVGTRSLRQAEVWNDDDAGSPVEGTDEPAENLAEQAAVWAERDPEAGLRWAASLADPTERDEACDALAWAAAASSPDVARQALEMLPTGEARRRLAAHVAAQWTALAVDDAERWAGSRPDPAERASALAAVATSLAETQPVRAANLVARDLPAGPARDQAVVAVVQRWIQSDPAGAERWVAAFTDPPLEAAARAVLTGSIPPRPRGEFESP